jgi:hypothetical protein
MQDLEFMDEEAVFLARAAEGSRRDRALDTIAAEIEQRETAWEVRLDTRFLALGRWAESGRLAARVREPAFFANPRNRGFPGWLRRELGETLPAEVRDRLAQVERAWASGVAGPDYPALEAGLTALIGHYEEAR